MKVFKIERTKLITLLTIVVVLLIVGFCSYRVYKIVYHRFLNFIDSVEIFKEKVVEENSIISEMIVEQRTCQLDSLPHNVLCIGNSITLHEPLDKINWYSSHGMAASKPEFDYCHVLEKMMRQHNPNTTVTPINLASWERNFSLSIDSLLRDNCKGKDIIVLRIGENVQTADIPKFENELSHLIEYLLQFTHNIIITGQYWPSQEKEVAIVRNVHRYKLKYVPIYWIWNLYRNECCPQEGDILYDTKGIQYQIKGDFITTHPNDKGMELIARSIYVSL